MISLGSSRFREILRGHLWKVKGSLSIAGLCLVGVTLCELLAPWPLKIILDYVLLGKLVPPSLSMIEALIHAGPLTALIALSSAIAVIALVGGILSYGRIFATSKLGYELVDVLRRELFSHVQRLSLSFHTKTCSGEILTKLAGDTKVLKNAFTDLPLTVSSHVLTFVGMLSIMLIMSWKLTLIILITLPPLGIAIALLNRKIHGTVRRQRKLEGKMTSRFNEVLSSISLIQAFGRESFEEDRFETESVQNLQSGIQTSRTTAAVSKVVALVSAIGTSATVFFGAWQVLKARMTPGDLLIFIAYVKGLYRPVKDVSKLSARFSQAWVSAERISELLNVQPDIQDHPTAIKADHLRGDILFEHVSFGYQQDNIVIHDVSFHARQGQKVALVGASGAGKSTIVSLLLRLYKPESGKIYIDDVDLAGYQRESLRQEIGIVLQDTLLFAASVAENISYGKPDATLGEIEEAAKLAHAHEFIMSLPEGYETIVGGRGSTLSGGQRQRICLARAIIKQPSILILDEPTSAVDSASAVLIRDAVARLQGGKTTLVIAHQFIAMDQFDQILVLENGCLVEQGTHRQLVARKGHYYALLIHQVGERREEDAYASNRPRPQPKTEGEAETYA
jgi:ATP-binding cassette, subfamily B, bacterial